MCVRELKMCEAVCTPQASIVPAISCVWTLQQASSKSAVPYLDIKMLRKRQAHLGTVRSPLLAMSTTGGSLSMSSIWNSNGT